MIRPYPKKQWVLLVFAGAVLVFVGIQFYWLQYIDVSVIDVLSIVTSLGLVGTLIALANMYSEDRENGRLQSDGSTESTNVPFDSERLTTDAICNMEAENYFLSIKDELHQAERLVNEAVNNLVSNIKYVSKLTRTHHDIVLASEKMAAPKENQQVLALLQKQMAVADKIEQELVMAVTSLQFGDLVTQLLGHTSRQVETLNKVLHRVKRREEQGDAEKALNEVQIEISDAVRKAKSVDERKPVVQQGMKVGEVELF